MTYTIIRYTWPEVNDAYLCPRKRGVPGGFWQNGVEGRRTALQFKSEACAKSFLAIHNYDLPPLKVTFECVGPDHRHLLDGVEEGGR